MKLTDLKESFEWTAEMALDKARDMGRRIPALEHIIAKNSRCSYRYAIQVLHDRFIVGEKSILLSPEYAYLYARDIIKGRWIKAEPVIAKSYKNAYFYARDIIKGRFPEAEPHILYDSEYAFFYARDVIKGRWKEAEPGLEKEPYHWKQYQNFLKLK